MASSTLWWHLTLAGTLPDHPLAFSALWPCSGFLPDFLPTQGAFLIDWLAFPTKKVNSVRARSFVLSAAEAPGLRTGLATAGAQLKPVVKEGPPESGLHPPTQRPCGHALAPPASTPRTRAQR